MGASRVLSWTGGGGLHRLETAGGAYQGEDRHPRDQRLHAGTASRRRSTTGPSRPSPTSSSPVPHPRGARRRRLAHRGRRPPMPATPLLLPACCRTAASCSAPAAARWARDRGHAHEILAGPPARRGVPAWRHVDVETSGRASCVSPAADAGRSAPRGRPVRLFRVRLARQRRVGGHGGRPADLARAVAAKAETGRAIPPAACRRASSIRSSAATGSRPPTRGMPQRMVKER